MSTVRDVFFFRLVCFRFNVQKMQLRVIREASSYPHFKKEQQYVKEIISDEHGNRSRSTSYCFTNHQFFCLSKIYSKGDKYLDQQIAFDEVSFSIEDCQEVLPSPPLISEH